MKPLSRDIKTSVLRDLKRKMVFVSGPRQSGKTTFAMSLLKDKRRYLNWDDDTDRGRLLNHELPSTAGLVVLDEIHKYARWRQLLKGAFDKRRDELQVLVTGSAMLDYYRRGGDSLQGRYFLYRLHPLSLMELATFKQSDLDHLLAHTGFPEPFTVGSAQQTRRFSQAYHSRLVREELRDLERVSEISLVERLVMRLPQLVGQPLSINGLREDLQVAHPTVARWVDILERLYALFRVYPFGASTVRAVKKEAKHYHFDWSPIADPGIRFENLVACQLLRWCHFLIDTQGWAVELRYFRDTDKREVDFVILKESQPIYFIECKLNDTQVSPSLRYLSAKFPKVEAIQIVYKKGVDFKDGNGIRVASATTVFQELRDKIGEFAQD